jgi:predicted kinase
MRSMLIVIGGLPGTGKTSLATRLARILDAVHLRIDTIEQAIRTATMAADDPRGAAGYVVACAVAEDNLRLGRIVVADSVNALANTRAAWRAVAQRAGVTHFEVELICSDASEHRRRVESRRPDIAGHKLPTWDEVREREYEPWTGDHVVVDTAQRTLDQSVSEVHAFLLAQERAMR